MAGRRDTPAHRAIAWAGWLFAVIGLLGVILWPRLLVVWVFLLLFGAAALPRAAIEWLREREREKLR